LVTALKDLSQKIIDILKADAVLLAAIKTWGFGEPVTVVPCPQVWVQLVGGPSRWKTGNTMQQKIQYNIVIEDRHGDRDTVEKAVMDYCDKVCAALKAKPDLDGNARCLGFDDFRAYPRRKKDAAIARIEIDLRVEREYV